MTTQQAICTTHEWETPYRQYAPGPDDFEQDGDDYCTQCGVERHEVEQPARTGVLTLEPGF